MNQHPLTTSVVPVYVCATSWINKALSLPLCANSTKGAYSNSCNGVSTSAALIFTW